MSDPESGDRWAALRARIPSPGGRNDSVRELVRAVLHEVRNLDAGRQRDGLHIEVMRELLEVLQHRSAAGTELDRAEHAATIAGIEALLSGVDGAAGRLAGRLEVLRRAVEAPARDAAMAATIATFEPADELDDGCSVLISAWNHATRLEAALDDACSLTDPGRVVVLDDASSDDTAAVLAARPEPVRVLRPPANIGLTRARNVLLRAAETRHALILDADNRIDVDAVRSLVDLAREWDAGVVHGVLVEVDGEGRPQRLLSDRPLGGEFFALRHNVVDSLGIVDVGAVRRVGGYTLDPGLETAEDWDMWHRLARAGELLVHAPFVVGHKLRVDRGHNSQPQDHDAQFATIDRTYRFDDRLDDETVAAAVVHPLLGPLWATAAAVDARPRLAAALPEIDEGRRLPPPPPARAERPAPVLVVGAGGVRNLGDDATTIETVRRLRHVLGPGVPIEVITDGARPLPLGADALWLGTIDEYAGRPLERHRAVIISGGGTLADHFARQLLGRVVVGDRAAEAAVPLFLTGQGIGPLDRHVEPVRRLLTRAAGVVGRDRSSVALATSLGATSVDLIGDDASAAAAPRTADLPAVLGSSPPGSWYAFQGRLASYSEAHEADLHAWASALDALAHDDQVPVVAVAQSRQPPWEEETLRHLAAGRTARWIIVDCTDDPDGARATYGLARGGVVRSFHAAWFGLQAGCPMLFPAAGPYYRGKADGLRELAGLDTGFFDPLAPTTTDELRRRLAVVADVVEARPIGGIDDAITEWLRAAIASVSR